MPYAIPQVLRPASAPYSVFADFFSPDECKKIIALSKTYKPQVAEVGSGPAAVVDAKKRVSEIRWVEWVPDHNWFFDKIANAIAQTNAQWFGFHLAGMNEALQLTHYKAKKGKRDAGHYDWHEDNGEGGGFQFRKLSFIIQLSDKYEGGKFRFLHHEVPEQKLGAMICFPSYKTHCVEAVTKGERWSLVGWITGPAFV